MQLQLWGCSVIKVTGENWPGLLVVHALTKSIYLHFFSEIGCRMLVQKNLVYFCHWSVTSSARLGFHHVLLLFEHSLHSHQQAVPLMVLLHHDDDALKTVCLRFFVSLCCWRWQYYARKEGVRLAYPMKWWSLPRKTQPIRRNAWNGSITVLRRMPLMATNNWRKRGQSF